MGNTFTSSQFFQYYFFLTAIHCVHLLIGFVVLGVLMYQLSDQARRAQVIGRDLRHLLAHGRLLLGPDLRPALRREVIRWRPQFNKRLFVVWLVLVGITLSYLWIDRAADRRRSSPMPSTLVTVGAICLALVKVRIIMREFMEVRSAPRLLCRLTDLWVVMMAVALLGTYFVGRTVA